MLRTRFFMIDPTSKLALPSRSNNVFNLTPIIDVIFLLIIFFTVVCQFISAENFSVNIPDNCEMAAALEQEQSRIVTLTVTQGKTGSPEFAVNADSVIDWTSEGVVDQLAGLLNTALSDIPQEERIVTLRIDRDIEYNKTQKALAAIAKSSATQIKMAVHKTADRQD